MAAEQWEYLLLLQCNPTQTIRNKEEDFIIPSVFQSRVWKQRAGASVTSGTTTRLFFLFPGGLIPSCFYASYMFRHQSLNVYSTRQKPRGTTFSIRLLPALDGFLTITSHFSPHNLGSQTVTFLYFSWHSEQPGCLFNPKTHLITNE